MRHILLLILSLVMFAADLLAQTHAHNFHFRVNCTSGQSGTACDGMTNTVAAELVGFGIDQPQTCDLVLGGGFPCNLQWDIDDTGGNAKPWAGTISVSGSLGCNQITSFDYSNLGDDCDYDVYVSINVNASALEDGICTCTIGSSQQIVPSGCATTVITTGGQNNNIMLAPVISVNVPASTSDTDTNTFDTNTDSDAAITANVGTTSNNVDTVGQAFFNQVGDLGSNATTALAIQSGDLEHSAFIPLLGKGMSASAWNYAGIPQIDSIMIPSPQGGGRQVALSWSATLGNKASIMRQVLVCLLGVTFWWSMAIIARWGCS